MACLPFADSLLHELLPEEERSELGRLIKNEPHREVFTCSRITLSF